MNILDTLRREVEEYRKKHGRQPGRILLKGEAAKAMADYICNQEHEKQQRENNLPKFGERSPDEIFLDGGMCYFKGIPVIAELDPEDQLVVDLTS